MYFFFFKSKSTVSDVFLLLNQSLGWFKGFLYPPSVFIYSSFSRETNRKYDALLKNGKRSVLKCYYTSSSSSSVSWVFTGWELRVWSFWRDLIKTLLLYAKDNKVKRVGWCLEIICIRQVLNIKIYVSLTVSKKIHVNHSLNTHSKGLAFFLLLLINVPASIFKLAWSGNLNGTVLTESCVWLISQSNPAFSSKEWPKMVK